MSTHSINLLDVTPRASTWRLWLLRFWVIGSVLATSFCVFKGLEASVPRPTTRQITVTEEVRRTKRMDEVRENDVVLARDEHGTEIGPRRVTQIFRRESDHLRLLTFEARDGTRQVIETTDEHPFACADSLDFIPAGQLPIGHQVPGPKGERQTLVASTREEHPEGIPVFNFEVEGFHTYFVTANLRQLSLLVHNQCEGYRVMSRDEFNGASHGNWADSPLVRGDPSESGRKWLWKEKEAAERWADFLRKHGEDPIVTRVPVSNPIDSYPSFPHSPEGTAVHVPISDLGSAFPIPGH